MAESLANLRTPYSKPLAMFVVVLLARRLTDTSPAGRREAGNKEPKVVGVDIAVTIQLCSCTEAGNG